MAVGTCAGSAVAAPPAAVVAAGVATVVGGFQYGSWIGQELGFHDWLGNALGDALSGVTQMGARNSGRVGHKGKKNSDKHSNAQNHGGSDKKPGMDWKKKRPPQTPPPPKESSGKPKFPNVDRCN